MAPDMTQMKQRLIELLVERSFKYSPEASYTLASGARSNYYIDCRTVTHHPEGKYLIGTIVYDRIRDLGSAAVGGLTMGADPIAVAVSYAAWLDGQSIGSFSIRKEPKGHGLGKQVEGAVQPGDRVVIVEDVITTGGSTIRAIEAARREGLTVSGVVALVDREEGGAEKVRAQTDTLITICTRSELMDAYQARQV